MQTTKLFKKKHVLTALLISITVSISLTIAYGIKAQEVKELKEYQTTIDLEIVALQEEINSLAEKEEKLKEKVNTLKEEKKELSKEIENKESKIENKDKVIEKKEDRIKELNKKLENLTAQKAVGYPPSSEYKKIKGSELVVKSTAYTAYCDGCSGITYWGNINLRKDPTRKVIAVDPKVIPLGSKVYVEGYGYAVAADIGSAIKGNKIDVFFPKKRTAYRWGRKTVRIKIIN